MKIKRKSPLTGKENEMDLPITEEQMSSWRNGIMIQVAMPHLTPAQREFLISGSTQEDWDIIHSEEDEDVEDA